LRGGKFRPAQIKSTVCLKPQRVAVVRGFRFATLPAPAECCELGQLALPRNSSRQSFLLPSPAIGFEMQFSH
jgi:hypothetical protein